MRTWRRLVDWWRASGERAAADAALCRHDGSEPWCDRCAAFYNASV